MSEIQKPVADEQPAAVVESAPVVSEPVAETKVEESAPAVEESSTVVEPTPAVTEAVEAETPAKVETPKKEFTGEGILGYKGPGGFIK